MKNLFLFPIGNIRSSLILNKWQFSLIDTIVLMPFLIVPFMINFPYRVNIFLSYEGAYRMYLGQFPFVDFGLPLGYGYWLPILMFFYMLGPSLYAVVMSQIFLNVIAFFALRGILYKLKLVPELVTISLLVYYLTFTVYNFWPWYNNTVIIYEFAAFYLLLAALEKQNTGKYLLLFLSAFLSFLSFFTKQDAGGICILICLTLLIFKNFNFLRNKMLIYFSLFIIGISVLFILPLLQYDFLYWFNYGQTPHSSRVEVMKILNVFMLDAGWEKLYLFIVIVLLLISPKKIWININFVIIFFGIIGQAIITRVTSPLPTDHMTYFHVIGVSFILYLILNNKKISRIVYIAIFCCVSIVYSSGYWGYIKKVFNLNTSQKEVKSNVRWGKSDLTSFHKVLMPEETISGINYIVKKYSKFENLKVLNLSELTPLAHELKYHPQIGLPLWYHKDIGIFQKEIDEIEKRIENLEYDLILFEDIPSLTEFYPYQLREAAMKNYDLEISFLAPRKLLDSNIEVYKRKD